MMRKTATYIVLLCMVFLSAAAQDLTSVFLNIPDNVLTGIDAEGKDTLIKNPADTAVVSTPSVFGGEVIRNEITEDYLSLQTSQAGTLQIKLLPLVNDSKIIAVVKTVCGKACDSQIQFYTTEWALLTDVTLFPAPQTGWFIKPGADKTSESFLNAFAALDMQPVRIDISGGKVEATVSLDAKNYLSEEDYNKIEPYLNESPKILTWDKISFKE